MSPTILLTGAASFVACLIVHVAVWRLARPRSDIKALFMIFLVLPALLILSAALFRQLTWVEGAATLLLHASLSAAYIQTYPAAQASSPSLEIMLAVGRSMPRGLDRNRLLQAWGSADLVHTRIDDLIANGWIHAIEGKFAVAPGARMLVRFFVGYRRFLGLQSKGG